MKKSYSKSLIFNIVSDACLVVLWMILIIYDRSDNAESFPIIPVMCGAVIVWAVAYCAFSSREYKLWKYIWKDPLWLSITSIILAVIGLVIIFISDNSLADELFLLMMLVGVLIRDIYNYKRALRYDMDNIESIEELLRLHPEVEKDLTKRALRQAKGEQQNEIR